jgi:hypothetical protein
LFLSIGPGSDWAGLDDGRIFGANYAEQDGIMAQVYRSRDRVYKSL